MFFVSTMTAIGGLFVLMLHNVHLYEVTSEYPSIPLTKLEVKCLEIKGKLREINYRRLQREVQENYDTRIHVGNIS